MPFSRCRAYDDDGNANNGGCPRLGICEFVHPSDPTWSRAPRRLPGQHQSSSERGRGRGRGRGGPVTGPRYKTGSNSIPRGGGVGSNASAETGWGSMSGSWSGTWGEEADKAEGSSTSNQGWSTGWGDGDETTKGDDVVKGKGKATEPSWGGGGWGQMDIDADASGSNGWDNDTWSAADIRAPEDGGWGSLSLNDTEAAASGWNVSEPSDESANTKPLTTSPKLGIRRPHDSSTLDRIAKKPRTESLKIPPAEPAAGMDVDSQQTSIPPLAVAISTAENPHGSPVVTNTTGPSFSLRRQITPGMNTSMQTSRATSLDAVGPWPSKESRTLKSVSHREARVIWNEYVELIYRPIMLRLRWAEERARHQDYKAAQNSSIYVKVGSRGTLLLDESIQALKGRVERRDKQYKDAVSGLCAFEDGFDFPIQLLTSRRGVEKKMKEELISLKEYVKDVKTCVDTMRLAVEDIDSRARVGPEPVATSTPIVTDGLEKSHAMVASVREKPLDKQLASLEDKAADFSNLFVDIRNGLNVSDVVQEKLEEMKATFRASMEIEDDIDKDYLSEKITKLSEEQASLGQDLIDMSGNVADIFKSVKQMEVAAEQEIDRLNKSLEEDRAVLAASETHTRDCQNLLNQSMETLQSLREQVRALQDSKAPAPSVGLPDELLDQLVAKILPAIRAELDPDIDTAMRNMTSSVAEVIQEHNKRQVQALSAALIPVFKMSGELQAKIEFKSQRVATRSRPASPHTVDSWAGAQVQTSHS